jgi:hypothetical protein
MNPSPSGVDMPSFSLRISVIMLSKVEAYFVPYFCNLFHVHLRMLIVLLVGSHSEEGSTILLVLVTPCV